MRRRRQTVAVTWAAQDGFDIRFDWGAPGVARIGPSCRTLVVVDILRFSTAVETGLSHGLVVEPERWPMPRSAARPRDTFVADGSVPGGPSLSPASLLLLPTGARVVLPSLNGATCALAAADTGAVVVACSLRNASAVARYVAEAPFPVGVIAAGDLAADGTLRPAVEDVLGSAALLRGLRGTRSPEATVAEAGFSAEPLALVRECASARQLASVGHLDDADWAAQLDVSTCVPVLSGSQFLDAAS
jgi:2-phosphosulfolactate phosphatase